MANTTTANMANPTPDPGATGQPMQSQCVYIMPVNQVKPARIIRPVPGVKCLSIATIVIGAVLVVLGIAAIVIKARMSYIADPIWTGLLFMVTTGILGIFVHHKKNNLCMNIAYLVMAIISAVVAYQLMEVAFIFAGQEVPWHCMPSQSWYIHYYCPPVEARVAVGVAIGLCAIAALVLCIVSCSVTLYGTFLCCYKCCACCRNESTPTVQYSAHSGQAMQVMGAPQLIPQGNPQQQPGGTQHVMIAAPQQHMHYPQYSPPAYMPTTQPIPSTQAFLVTQQTNQSCAPPGVDVAQQAERHQQQTPGQEQAANDRVSDKPNDWQTFQ